MNFNTFYKIYYRHRIHKASLLLKLYLYLIIPIKYLLNYFYFEKKINLDQFANINKNLYDSSLGFLFEFFNSDKGKEFYDQYQQPLKINRSIKIKAHNYAPYYEKYLDTFKYKKNVILELGSFDLRTKLIIAGNDFSLRKGYILSGIKRKPHVKRSNIQIFHYIWWITKNITLNVFVILIDRGRCLTR